MSTLSRWLYDTAERAGLTFVEAMLAFIAANTTGAWSLDQGKAAILSAAVAALAVVKAAVASRFGSSASASLLPSNPGVVK